MLILIPPSETKYPGGTHKSLNVLNETVRPVIDLLQKHRGDLGAFYGVKGKVLAQAIETNAKLLKAPTLPAIERYNGVVYDGIDYPTMSPKAKLYFNKHVRIVSALFGLLKPQDLIPDYKLKIEKLNLCQYWKPLNAKQLKDNFIFDLLPQTHAKAVDYDKGLRLDFIVTKNGKTIPAGHQGKLIKGKFIRWMCENNINDVNQLGAFREDGFVFNGQQFVKK